MNLVNGADLLEERIQKFQKLLVEKPDNMFELFDHNFYLCFPITLFSFLITDGLK